MGRLHTAAEHRREEPGELHSLPILQRRAKSLAHRTHARARLVGASAKAKSQKRGKRARWWRAHRLATVGVLPASGSLGGRGVEAERKGEGLVPRCAPAARSRAGVRAAGRHGEELVEEIVFRALRRRLPSHVLAPRGPLCPPATVTGCSASLCSCHRRPGTEAVCSSASEVGIEDWWVGRFAFY